MFVSKEYCDNWKKFEIVSTKSVDGSAIETMSRDKLSKVVDQLNLVGKLPDEENGKWLIVETKELQN